jgi:transcriptional regulator with XRE-family HTH domain
MKQSSQEIIPPFGPIKNVRQLGSIIRKFRKDHQLTLEIVSGLTNIGMRFLSELERGKETAELGKTLAIINKIGLEVIIQPRGYKPSPVNTQKDDKKE